MSDTRKQITTYLEPAVFARLEAAANASGRTVSEMVDQLLTVAMDLIDAGRKAGLEEMRAVARELQRSRRRRK